MLGFRALQAIMDLRAAAGRQPRAAIRGIVSWIPSTDVARGADAQALAQVILHQGGRLEQREDLVLLDALKLAASQPEKDLPAFTCATAILLADRLQHGLGDDDLGFHWQAFQQVYSSLESHDRAAIFQGFLTGGRMGRLRASPPFPGVAHLTDDRATLDVDLRAIAARGASVLDEALETALGPEMALLARPHLRRLLEGASPEPLTGDSPIFAPLLAIAGAPDHPAWTAATGLLLAEALGSNDAEGWFAISLWPEQIGNWLELGRSEGRPLLAGLRHLYEADQGWLPMPDRRASPRDLRGYPLLPVLDASYTGGRRDAPAG